MPEPLPGEAFATLVEQGPVIDVARVGPLELYALDGPVAAFICYQPWTGAYWLVVGGVHDRERVCIGEFAPHVNLAMLDLDDDGQDDVLGHDVRTGLAAMLRTERAHQAREERILRVRLRWRLLQFGLPEQ